MCRYTTKDDAQRAVDAIHDKVKDKDAPGLVQVRFAHTKEERAAHLSHVLGAHAGHPHPAAAAAMHAAMMRGIPAAHLNPAFAHQLTYSNHPHHPHHPHASHPAAYPHPMSLGQGKYAQNGGYPLYTQPSYPTAGQPRGGEYGQLQAPFTTAYGEQPPQAQQQAQYGGGGYAYNAYGAHHPHHPHPVNGGAKDVRGPEGANLFVYNVPEHYTENDLNHLFGNFGSVLSTRVQRDLNTGVSKGFGFVSYDDAQAAQSAIHALDGFSIGNKRLTVRVKTANPRNNFRADY